MGNYYLCDAIKINKKRIELKGQTQFLMEIDVRKDEDVCFESKNGMPYMIKEPDSDEYTATQLTELKSYINTLEDFLYSEQIVTADENKFLEMGIDIESFIKWWLINEILGNYDASAFGRHVTYDCNDGKVSFKMQPVWDFDRACYERIKDWNNTDMYHRWYLKDSTYYPQLLKNPYFVNKVKTIWNTEFYTIQDDLFTYIEQIRTYIKKSALLDRKVYPDNQESSITGIKRKDFDAYNDHNVYFLKERFSWLNSEIQKLTVD